MTVCVTECEYNITTSPFQTQKVYITFWPTHYVNLPCTATKENSPYRGIGYNCLSLFQATKLKKHLESIHTIYLQQKPADFKFSFSGSFMKWSEFPEVSHIDNSTMLQKMRQKEKFKKPISIFKYVN